MMPCSLNTRLGPGLDWFLGCLSPWGELHLLVTFPNTRTLSGGSPVSVLSHWRWRELG